MNSAELIAAARRKWCADSDGVPGYPAYPCPPAVVAALLDVLADAWQGADPFEGHDQSGRRALAAIKEALK